MMTDTPLNQLPQSEIVDSERGITHQRERLMHALLAIGSADVQKVTTDLWGMVLRRRHRIGIDPEHGQYYYTNDDFWMETQQFLESPDYQALEDQEAKACLAWCVNSWRQYYGADNENQ